MSTYQRLQEILAQDYRISSEKMALTTLLEDLNIDSLATMELLFKLEDEFQIRVPVENVPLSTIEDVVNYVDKLRQQLPHTPLAVPH